MVELGLELIELFTLTVKACIDNYHKYTDNNNVLLKQSGNNIAYSKKHSVYLLKI